MIRGFVRSEADDPKRVQRAAAAARRAAKSAGGAAAAEGSDEDEAAAVDKVAEGEQVLPLCNERFMVPEALLHPSGVGSLQAGLAEACLDAVNACSEDIRPLLWSRALLVGGLASTPGLLPRLLEELRPLVPDDCQLHLTSPPQPAAAAWRGAAAWAAQAGGVPFAERALGLGEFRASTGAGARVHAERYLHHGTDMKAPKGRVW